MHNKFFVSLFFVLLTSFSIMASAAPTAGIGSKASPSTHEISAKQQSGKVDLNTADAKGIQAGLAGVGEAKAQAIVAYRDMNGPFASVDELLEVKGIGKAILDMNREKIDLK